jgi:hypothetical protein
MTADLPAGDLEEFADDVAEDLGIELLTESRGSGQVSEDRRNDAPLGGIDAGSQGGAAGRTEPSPVRHGLAAIRATGLPHWRIVSRLRHGDHGRGPPRTHRRTG